MRRSPVPRSVSPAGTRRGLRWGLFAVGWMLSPLTPWNDAWVNVPASVGLAPWIARVADLDLVRAFAAAYALTNLLGLAFMGLALLLGYRRGEGGRRPQILPLPRVRRTAGPRHGRRAA